MLLLTCPAAAEEPSPSEHEHERVFLEAGFGLSQSHEDAYTRRLAQFGFDRGRLTQSTPSLVGMVSLGTMLTRNVGVLARYEGLEHHTYGRTLSEGRFGPDDSFEWSTRAVSLGLRGRLPIRAEWLALYVEGSGGFAWARTRAWGKSLSDRQLFRGFALGGRIGLLGHATRNFGFFAETGYSYAPVLENLLGETHNDGGISVITGVRLRLMGASE